MQYIRNMFGRFYHTQRVIPRTVPALHPAPLPVYKVSNQKVVNVVKLFEKIQSDARGIYRETPDLGIYDDTRRYKYGDTTASYSGRVRPTQVLQSTQSYLEKNHISIVKCHFEAPRSWWYSNMNDKGLSFVGHTYFYIEEEELIIDTLYRNLFMVHRGHVDKWFSPYAEYLFKQLPPVFVGTYTDMLLLVKHMNNIRKSDLCHKDDPYVDFATVYNIDSPYHILTPIFSSANAPQIIDLVTTASIQSVIQPTVCEDSNQEVDINNTDTVYTTTNTTTTTTTTTVNTVDTIADIVDGL
jgi:hypothetical protein